MIRNNLKSLWKGMKSSYASYNYHAADVILFLTYRCTSQCKACNIWKRPVEQSDELSWEQWQPIFKQFVRHGIKSVELFGGDALLRKDLMYDMIRFCSANNIETFFPTNSSSLNKETAQKLVDSGLSTLYISLDEIPEISGEVRGVKRHAERVKKSIDWIKQARGSSQYPRIICITTVSSMNYKYLYDFIEICEEAGVDTHQLRGITEFPTSAVNDSEVDGVLPEPYFMPTDDKSRGYNIDDAKKLLEILHTIRTNEKNYKPLAVESTNMHGVTLEHLQNLSYPQHSCLFCTTQMVLTPYGDVLPCLYYNNYHLGNLVEQDIPEVWGNSRHRSFCNKQQNDEIPMCKYCSIKPYHKNFTEKLKNLAGKFKYEFLPSTEADKDTIKS